MEAGGPPCSGQKDLHDDDGKYFELTSTKDYFWNVTSLTMARNAHSIKRYAGSSRLDVILKDCQEIKLQKSMKPLFILADSSIIHVQATK